MIPYNVPYTTGDEFDCIRQAIERRHLSGDGTFTRNCQELLRQRFGSPTLLTQSCSAALELAMLLVDIQPGDEVIMPSFTFVSTANAVVLRGGRPVFVDIDAKTLNIDPERVAAAVTPRTRAVIVVHYASVACDMDRMMAIANERRLTVVEDAAHCFGARYRNLTLGTIGALGTLSFHETKNVNCGEGGALLVNDPKLVSAAEIAWQKGTNRKAFLEGRVDKYSWVGVGSSYLPSELSAAFLYAQLRAADSINAKRLQVWSAYHEQLEELERRGILRRPHIPEGCIHNAHLYYVIVNETVDRAAALKAMRAEGVDAIFHYVPLHEAEAGRRLGKVSGDMSITETMSRRLIRLPLWPNLPLSDVDRIVSVLQKAIS
jgi:dTDP-4-amino-4,6-dideoxygalactose transaminase